MHLHVTNINASVFIASDLASFTSTLVQTNGLVITQVQFGEPTPRNMPPSIYNNFTYPNNWLNRCALHLFDPPALHTTAAQRT